ncbi:MAG: helix-turn-helix transcriptional regulator [Armatimonadetes bacterium]|nr:helix-turn-helix transcriptional regulator [Armatimonadota bacterium]
MAEAQREGLAFSRRLKKLRLKRGLNQAQLAARVGYSQGHISLLEDGKRVPNARTLSDFASFFEVSTDYLLGRSNLEKTQDEYTKMLMENRLNDLTSKVYFPQEARKRLWELPVEEQREILEFLDFFIDVKHKKFQERKKEEEAS